jgi:hypothetical protein
MKWQQDVKELERGFRNLEQPDLFLPRPLDSLGVWPLLLIAFPDLKWEGGRLDDMDNS